jgi:magnesium transporter
VPIEKVEKRPLKMNLFEYGPEMPVQKRQSQTLSDVFPFNSQIPVTWLSVDGNHQLEILSDIGNCLDIHPLTLEDILDTSQRPRMEIFEHYLFIELNMLLWDQDRSQIQAEQISLILGDRYVIMF